MTADRELWEQQRDQALRDLVDLERQVDEGELPQEVGEALHRRYELDAARAIDALAEQPVAEQPHTAPARRPSRARGVAYVLAAVIAVFSAAVLLPQYVMSRPDGGFVTGNEVVEPAPPAGMAPPPRDLSKVTDAEMEAVISANPGVVGMRLALADRYLEKGKYEKAAKHYGEALKQDPDNPDVHARSGWLLYKIGKPDPALRFVDRALEIDPSSLEALWFKANILLHGRKDPDAALEVLRTLAGRTDLPAELREPVNKMIRAAKRAGGQ